MPEDRSFSDPDCMTGVLARRKSAYAVELIALAKICVMSRQRVVFASPLIGIRPLQHCIVHCHLCHVL